MEAKSVPIGGIKLAVRALGLSLFISLGACGQDSSTEQKSAAAPTDEHAGNEDALEKNPDVDGAVDDPHEGAGDGNEDLGGKAHGGTNEEGRAYFKSAVAPMFQTACVSCHADPRQPADIRGPLSIYSYDSMKAKLAVGKSSQVNDLFKKVRNMVAHAGGDRCSSLGLQGSPCKELLNWWKAEYGQDPVGVGSRGRISEVTSLGEVFGYAINPASLTQSIVVHFYADGPKGEGLDAGTVTANVDGLDGNTAGSHAFTFNLSAALRDGKPHKLYGYAVIDGVELPLADDDAPTAFTAYSFTAAGRAYYTANVKSKMTACTGCHTVTYEQQFYSLISPSPAEGATATNNQLINKPSQTNATSHGGGLLCASPAASPCKEFQAWWKLEFGG